ncbi:MAG: ferrous iron transport protein A [Candidatus Omnitrophica bacterium]|jgi:Fe2+ transport system protein FeoA|nr:ferrous iron transport protein A [Candidatus Omnitrophota bacterium]
MKKISLAHLKENQKARILEISGGSNLASRLMSMGIYPGTTVTKLNHFAMRGPVTIKCGRSTLAIGYGVAAKIIVELA